MPFQHTTISTARFPPDVFHQLVFCSNYNNPEPTPLRVSPLSGDGDPQPNCRDSQASALPRSTELDPWKQDRAGPQHIPALGPPLGELPSWSYMYPFTRFLPPRPIQIQQTIFFYDFTYLCNYLTECWRSIFYATLKFLR